MSGSFPNTNWNGDINSIYGNVVLFDELNQILNNTNIPIILDFSNSLLEEFDTNDTYGNLILKAGNSGGHMISIVSPILHSYIIQNYPEYNCILSKNIFYTYQFLGIDHFNEILNSDQFKFVELPPSCNKDIDFLKSITTPKKVIITLMNKCNNCENLSECILLENNFQINYSSKTILDKCSQQFIDYSKNNELEQLITYYTQFSINTFKIDNPAEDNIKNFNYFLIINLIKNEFITDFFKFLQDKGYSL